jgi:ATP-dependent helicase HrpB
VFPSAAKLAVVQLPDLPVLAILDPLRAALAARPAAVLVAPPGAGKTTVVPLALLAAEWLESRKIVVLEPRRLAARAAARRMASLRGEEIGDTVGYRIRRESRIGPTTRIEVVTEGILTRMLQSDPALEGTGLLVFDEFHERSLHADLGLALSLASQRLLRDDLRLLVMSATLDAAPVADLVGAGDAAPVIAATGREYPVETRYLDRSGSRIGGDRIEPAVAAAIARALRERAGDVLVFLPGAGEIRRTAERLEAMDLPESLDLYPLFGNLSRGEQDRAIAPSPAGRRKVVLATAIAQTSLTIEGVAVVIDSGWMRLPRFNPATGMTGLETVRVTADVAEQRRGRAGRTAPGICYRQWTEGEQRGLVPRLRPEILDADLAPLMLELALWGADADELAWLDPPPAVGVEQALGLLRQLDLVGDDGNITQHGRRVAALGVHPRLGHMLVRAKQRGLGLLGCHLAALVGERDLLRRSGEATDADLRLRLEALRLEAPRQGRGRRAIAGHDIDRGRLERALAEARTFARSLSVPVRERLATADIERAGELLALAYPDRIARRRHDSPDGPAGTATTPGAPRGARYLLRNGRGAALAEGQSLAACAWIVVSDVGDRGREARIYQAAPIEPRQIEELFASQVEEVDDVRWNSAPARVEATRDRRLGALVLARAPLREPDADRVAEALLDGVRSLGLRALPWSKVTRQLHQRLRFAHAVDPETWPDVGERPLMATLADWLGPFVGGMRGLSDLARLDLAQLLWTRVGWQRQPALDELAPTHLEVPSGSRLPVDYSDAAAPALAVRLQEVFGWRETPRIGGGRVPVTLRLLSPAQRPVQVTTDLASFWRDAYFAVKKELKGRYPKHYWPDDPLTAEATRRVRPRR